MLPFYRLMPQDLGFAYCWEDPQKEFVEVHIMQGLTSQCAIILDTVEVTRLWEFFVKGHSDSLTKWHYCW